MTGLEDEEGRMGDQDPRSERPYRAFLLRCWQEENGWRYSLEAIDPGVGERRRRQGFDSLNAFLDGLQSELARRTDPGDDPPAESR